jgi:hypothetical protein
MISKRLDMTPHLTVGHDQGLTQCFAESFEGMAHFAGTGPKGEQCKTCRHWGNGSGPKQRAQTRPCAKFVSITGVESKGVPREQPLAATSRWWPIAMGVPWTIAY